jgi:hypothetical protein
LHRRAKHIIRAVARSEELFEGFETAQMAKIFERGGEFLVIVNIARYILNHTDTLFETV